MKSLLFVIQCALFIKQSYMESQLFKKNLLILSSPASDALYLINSFQSFAKVKCLSKCRSNQQCKSIIFNNLTSVCNLYSEKKETFSSIDSSLYVYYKVNLSASNEQAQIYNQSQALNQTLVNNKTNASSQTQVYSQGQVVQTIFGHIDRITCLLELSNGYLVSGSFDQL